MVASVSLVMTEVVTGASTIRTSVRDAVTTTVSPRPAICNVTTGTASDPSETSTDSTVASEKPLSDTVTV